MNAIKSIANKLIAQSDKPIDKCRDVTLPSDLDGYVPRKPLRLLLVRDSERQV